MVGLWFDGQKHFGARYDLSFAADGCDPIIEDARLWLDSYFEGRRPDPRLLCLKPRGSEFMLRVWGELLSIPYGEALTYGELAARIGCRSARAVGAAVGRNPVSIVIPCHRVVGAGGSLVGYAGGIERKKWLIEHERK